MTRHEIKIQKQWFDRAASGQKRAEIRKHDRDYQAGDELLFLVPNLVAWEPTATSEVLHVLPGHQVDGLDNEYCVLSITEPAPLVDVEDET